MANEVLRSPQSPVRSLCFTAIANIALAQRTNPLAMRSFWVWT
jgi:hypothetical protein